MVDRPEGLNVGFGLPRVVPQELGEESVGFRIDLETNGLHARAAFKHVELRTDDEGVSQPLQTASASRQSGITHARRKTHAGEYPARLLLADGADELLAQFRQRTGMQQHHAMLAEPDQSILCGESEQVAQIIALGVVDGLQAFLLVCAAPAVAGLRIVFRRSVVCLFAQLNRALLPWLAGFLIIG